jgi:hypothetical protein
MVFGHVRVPVVGDHLDRPGPAHHLLDAVDVVHPVAVLVRPPDVEDLGLDIGAAKGGADGRPRRLGEAIERRFVAHVDDADDPLGIDGRGRISRGRPLAVTADDGPNSLRIDPQDSGHDVERPQIGYGEAEIIVIGRILTLFPPGLEEADRDLLAAGPIVFARDGTDHGRIAGPGRDRFPVIAEKGVPPGAGGEAVPAPLADDDDLPPPPRRVVHFPVGRKEDDARMAPRLSVDLLGGELHLDPAQLDPGIRVRRDDLVFFDLGVERGERRLEAVPDLAGGRDLPLRFSGALGNAAGRSQPYDQEAETGSDEEEFRSPHVHPPFGPDRRAPRPEVLARPPVRGSGACRCTWV